MNPRSHSTADDDDDIAISAARLSSQNSRFQRVRPAPKETDALVAMDLNNMSLNDREEVFFELHGVAPAVDETPDMIARSLEELDENIEKIPVKPAYDLAEAQDKEYVRNPDFRIKFLRAERFNSLNAADRLVRFFEQKVRLFGPKKLAKDIMISDLDPEDITCLESGMNTSLPVTDRAGRAVFCMVTKLRGTASSTSVVSC